MEDKAYVVGIDVGTGSARTGIVDASTGVMVASATKDILNNQTDKI